jgi:transcriptional regulator with PAS, ATPase and Fis domain
MEEHFWTKEFPGAITVCDREGKIIEMNDKSAKTFSSDGGYKLLGQNVMECHPEPARTQLQGMMEHETSNVYMIQKNGIKKLIYQCPVYQEGVYSGFIEMALELPENMLFFDRDKKK